MSGRRTVELIREKITSDRSPLLTPARGDFDLNPQWRAAQSEQRVLKPAAVLMPIILREDEPSVLFTRRADHLTRHAGQVSFPGGRIDDDDRDAASAALRETEEEIGLDRQYIEICGQLDTYETGTGYAIQPFVGFVTEGFELKVDASEVAEAFEVPLHFLVDPANVREKSTRWQGQDRRYFEMTYGRHYIWGATAGILVSLHNRLYR